jgi:hypothetical protein
MVMISHLEIDNNCTSCHKNFTKDEFDHKLTGLVLSEIHNELDCKDCHIDGNFCKILYARDVMMINHFRTDNSVRRDKYK